MTFCLRNLNHRGAVGHGCYGSASMLLQYYVTESMYHQLQCMSDVSMKPFHPPSKTNSIPFCQTVYFAGRTTAEISMAASALVKAAM